MSVQSAGLLKNDMPYLIMELLHGEGLGARLGTDGVLELDEVVRTGLEVLAGLEVAHDAGFIHRDVKPENVFMATDGEAEVAKLLDFSVARLASDSVRVTATGDIIGTPAYLAPEQAAGIRDQDGRIDIWSTGVLLYRTITGQTPFRGQSLGELIVRIVSQDPIPLRRLRPETPEALEAVVLRALRRERDERFAGAAGMAAALRASV